MIYKATRSRAENEKLWQERMARLRCHRGTVSTFCRAEGVRPAFIPVEVVAERPLQSEGRLPNPRWVAELVLHLCGSAR